MFSTAYKCGAAWNDSFWCNDRFDELMVKARSELDEAKRREMYYEMQALVSERGRRHHPDVRQLRLRQLHQGRPFRRDGLQLGCGRPALDRALVDGLSLTA